MAYLTAGRAACLAAILIAVGLLLARPPIAMVLDIIAAVVALIGFVFP